DHGCTPPAPAPSRAGSVSDSGLSVMTTSIQTTIDMTMLFGPVVSGWLGVGVGLAEGGGSPSLSANGTSADRGLSLVCGDAGPFAGGVPATTVHGIDAGSYGLRSKSS